MPVNEAGIVTAGLRPELFNEPGSVFINRRNAIIFLIILLLAGFALRVGGLSAEGLSEDELNKLAAVTDYRTRGLTSTNGEHPFLMKALQSVSVIAAEKWNGTAFAKSDNAARHIPIEAALRFPSTVFGTLTVIVLFLLTAELFGVEVGLIAAALWAVDPNAIGFNRIAKEDTFFLFFFLLANVFWLRGQRVAEGEPERNPRPFYWATAAAWGAMVASKYIPYFIMISVCYNYIFQGLRIRHWQIGRPRYLMIILIMTVVFFLCNPTILLPETWREMLTFATEKRIAHDGYEFLGRLYSHKWTDWLKGTPWYFYYVFVAVKIPLLTLAAFLIGLPLAFQRKLGDGRYFLMFWTLFGFMPFTVAGGKFTRYFTTALPLVLITAAFGLQFVVRQCAAFFHRNETRNSLRVVLVSLVIIASALTSYSALPHYRLQTNSLGGGMKNAGDYFPHDEFYDAGMRQTLAEIARRAKFGARVASETAGLAEYYAKAAGRPDLICVSLSDQKALNEMSAGDFLLDARGRRYFSNDQLLSNLRSVSTPAFQIKLGEVPAVNVFLLDEQSLAIVQASR